MFYGSPDHRQKHHHARQYQSFDSSNGYPAYPTTQEPMPFPEGQQFQYGNPIFNDNYMEYAPEESRRFHAIEYEPARHKHHHARQYQSFDSSKGYPFFGTMSNGYPVYATTHDPMPYSEGQQFQYGNPLFNNNHIEYVPEESRRFRAAGYEPARFPVQAKANKVKENVDAEAEEFIQHEHKKFRLSKLRSELSG